MKCVQVLLVLLHDFPEFLGEHHASLCDVIPASCIQLRNLILSAFPRSMLLPDPFAPQLKIDMYVSAPFRVCVVPAQYWVYAVKLKK